MNCCYNLGKFFKEKSIPFCSWLQALFNWEFICVPGEERHALGNTLHRLTMAGLIFTPCYNTIEAMVAKEDELRFLAALIKVI